MSLTLLSIAIAKYRHECLDYAIAVTFPSNEASFASIENYLPTFISSSLISRIGVSSTGVLMYFSFVVKLSRVIPAAP